MTIKDCIDIVDNIKPNQYTIKDKVMWLSFLEEIIINDVLKTHEGYEGRYDDFEGYSEDRLTVPLIVPSPYDRLYTEYLKMMIDKENGEIARYNNSMVSYNTYMMEYRKHYNKTHMPLDITAKRRDAMPPKAVSVGLSDAEYENLKRDMTYILTEYFGKEISPDKLYDIVKNFIQNNAEMLKGKDGKEGYTPVKGTDYFTSADIEEFNNTPKMVVKFANGISFESREDGLYAVYDEIENCFISGGEVLANDSDFAYMAQCDIDGNEIPDTYATKEELNKHLQNDFESIVERADILEQSVESFALLTDEETTPFATKEEVGNISAVLDELHTYAQTLIDGGVSV